MSAIKDLNLTPEQAREVAHLVGAAWNFARYGETMKAMKGLTLTERADLVLSDETLLAQAVENNAAYKEAQEEKRAKEKDLKVAAQLAKAIMPLVIKKKMTLQDVEAKWGVPVRAAVEARQSIS